MIVFTMRNKALSYFNTVFQSNFEYHFNLLLFTYE